MTRRHASAQQLAPQALIDLYQIDTTKYGGGITCWTPGPMGEAAGNLIWNPRCRSNMTGWGAEATPTLFGPVLTALAGFPDFQLPEGAAVVKYASLAAYGTKAVFWAETTQINPGQLVQVQALVQPRSVKVRVGAQFVTSSGTFISNVWSPYQADLGGLAAANSLALFSRLWVNATAPAGAAGVRLVMEMAPPVDGSPAPANIELFWTRAMMVPLPPSARELPTPLEFAPGAKVGSVSFGGQVYTPLPIRFEGVQRTGRGPVPRITLVIPDIDSLGTAIMVSRGNLLGCPISRKQVFRHALDDGESPDTSDFFGPEIFYVDRVARWVPGVEIALECASPLDIQGTRLPARQVIADVCGLTYRTWNGTGFNYGSCPYAGASYFKADNSSTVVAAEDVCSKSLKGCRARFGTATALPAFMFPGVSRARY